MVRGEGGRVKLSSKNSQKKLHHNIFIFTSFIPLLLLRCYFYDLIWITALDLDKIQNPFCLTEKTIKDVQCVQQKATIHKKGKNDAHAPIWHIVSKIAPLRALA